MEEAAHVMTPVCVLRLSRVLRLSGLRRCSPTEEHRMNGLTHPSRVFLRVVLVRVSQLLPLFVDRPEWMRVVWGDPGEGRVWRQSGAGGVLGTQAFLCIVVTCAHFSLVLQQ